MRRLKIDLNKRGHQWLALLFLAFIWGTSFILMKKGLQSYSNQQVAAFRVFFSFIFILPFTLKNLGKISKQNLFSLIVVGLVGIALPALLFTTAQTKIPSSLAGMLNSFTPLSTLLVGVILYKSNVRIVNLLGIIVGLAGAIGLIMNNSVLSVENVNMNAFLVILATMCYGINVNEVKYKLQDLNGIEITALAFLFIGPLSGIYLLFSDFSKAQATPEYIQNLMYIAVLALFSSVLAVIIFNNLIKYTTGIFAASVTYIIPVFAIFWGLFDGENVSIIQIGWISIILLGVYLVNHTPRKKEYKTNEMSIQKSSFFRKRK